MSVPVHDTTPSVTRDTTPDRSALTVRSLHVRRVRSIDVPYTLSDLSPGVNIVHGANGSGKSSTALALQVALWSHAPAHQIDVACDFTTDGVHFHARVADGTRAVQQDGLVATGPAMPSWDHHLRYRLALHDLLVAADKGDDHFAQQIALASTGFRFDEARAQLGFRDRHTTRVDESLRVAEAAEQLRRQQAAQRAMHEQERHLETWRAELAESRTAHARQLTVERAIEHARAAADRAAALEQLSHFDADLAHVPANAVERAEQLLAQQQDAAALAHNDAREAEQLRTTAATRLPRSEASAADFEQLRALGEALVKEEATLAEADRTVAAQEAQQARCRDAVADQVRDEQLQQLVSTAFGDVERFARDAESFNARWAAANAQYTLAHSMRSDAPTSTREQIERGVQLLGAWLRDEPAGTAGTPAAPVLRPYIVVLAVAAVTLGVIVSMLNTGSWLVAAALVVVVALVVAALAFKATAPRATEPVRPLMRPVHEEEFRALGLRSPATWSTRDVQRCMDTLHAELASLAVHERREEWKQRAQAERDALTVEREALEARHTTLLRQLGVSPTTGPGGITWLVLQVAAWQQAWVALHAALAAQQHAREHMLRTRARVTERVSDIEPGTVASEWRGEEVIRRADRWLQEWERAQQELAQAVRAEDRAADHRARAEQLQHELTGLFGQCGCPAGDMAALRAQVDRREQYERARRHAEQCVQSHERARTALQEDPHFRPDLLDCTMAQLADMREQLTQLADRAAPLADRVAQLEAQMQQAGSTQQVAAALAELSVREEALDACWRRDLEAMIGHAVLEEVRRATRDTERPAVFTRARELFAQITRGRYRLDFHDGVDADTPAFRAFDTETRRSHPVHELSTGTRVQLLLAVRVAFIERTETGVRIPLLIDEALGTSDAHRAGAIMDAITALAASGRQVFYFTAQREEVAKWERHLQHAGVPHRVLDLDAIRMTGEAEANGSPFVPQLVAPVPAPLAGESYLAYGTRLGVPPFDALRHDAGEAHLWYVAPDTEVLHTLLSLGVQRCGSLAFMVEQGGADVLGAAVPHWPTLRAGMAALAALVEGTTTGLGARLTREHLEASEAVSDKKMPEVLDVLAQHGGRANAFWRAVENGAVKNFQVKQRDKLYEYLQEQELLDDRAPLSPELVTATVLRAISQAGATNPADVGAMLNDRLGSPPRPGVSH